MSNSAAALAAAIRSGPAQQQASVGKSRDRQPVPGGHDLVVPAGPGPLTPCGQQGSPHPLEPAGIGRVRAELKNRGAVLERAGLRDSEHAGGVAPVLRAERGDQLGWRPHIERALGSVAVRVQGRGEPALGGAAARRSASRRSVQRPDGPERSQCGATGAHTRGPAARCRTASSRSAERPSPHPRCSARTRPRAGHRYRPWPSRQRSSRPLSAPARRPAPSPAQRGAAGTPGPSTAGTSERRRTRRGRRRTRGQDRDG